MEAEDLGIKLANTKYELNRLQREHIKLQLEQEKVLEKFESITDSLKTGEEEKLDLNEKSGTESDEGKMYKKGNTVNIHNTLLEVEYLANLSLLVRSIPLNFLQSSTHKVSG